MLCVLWVSGNALNPQQVKEAVKSCLVVRVNSAQDSIGLVCHSVLVRLGGCWVNFAASLSGIVAH